MADYGVQATEMSKPQAAGDQVIQPAQSIDGSKALFNVVGGVLDIFAKGIQQNEKQKQEQQRQSVLNAYLTEERKIANAFRTGELTAVEASGRSRTNFANFSQANPGLQDELDKAAKAQRSYGMKGEFETEEQRAADIRKKDVEQAQARGAIFYPGMSKAAEDAEVTAAKQSIRAEQDFDNYVKKQNEVRAAGRYNKELADAETKLFSTKMLSNIAGTHLESFQEMVNDLGDKVRSGKMDQKTAQALITQRFSNISAAIQTVAGQNPELASPWRSIFNEIKMFGDKITDPKFASEDYKSQYDAIIAKGKLFAVTNDPQVLAGVVTTQLAPQSAAVALRTSEPILRAFNALALTNLTDEKPVPAVIGSDIEKPILDQLKIGLKDLKAAGATNEQISTVQATNSVNQLLKQVGQIANTGTTDVNKLSKFADFLSSDEFGKFASKGTLDKDSLRTTSIVFKNVYEKQITQGVQKKLNEFIESDVAPVLVDAYGLNPATRAESEGRSPLKFSDFVDVSFNGSGVSLSVKGLDKLSPEQRASVNTQLQSLKSSERAINQLIRIGAHMEGTQDYAKVWKENRHRFMPGIFPEPTQLKVGDRVMGSDGKLYEFFRDGNDQDRNNWRVVE